METTEIKQQVLKFEKARNNLLVVIAYSVINLILTAFDAGVIFLFSTTLPQFVFVMGRNLAIDMGSNIFATMGLVIAIILIIPYFVFWLLAKRARVLILVALILISIDSLLLLYFIIGIEFQWTYLLELAFRVWILYYLINGVMAWAKIRNISIGVFNVILKEVNSKNIASGDKGESDKAQREEANVIEDPQKIEEEKQLHKKDLCKYCKGKLSKWNGKCKSCGKGNIKVCNKCGGKMSAFNVKCIECGKEYLECLYCKGELNLKSVCKNCGRPRAY